jgi:transketolase C-terminal domain/subunit
MFGIVYKYGESAELKDLFEKYKLQASDIVRAAQQVCNEFRD